MFKEIKGENSANLAQRKSSKIKAKIIRLRKAERSCLQQTCTMRSPGQRKIIANTRLELQEERKKPEMGK